MNEPPTSTSTCDEMLLYETMTITFFLLLKSNDNTPINQIYLKYIGNELFIIPSFSHMMRRFFSNSFLAIEYNIYI